MIPSVRFCLGLFDFFAVNVIPLKSINVRYHEKTYIMAPSLRSHCGGRSEPQSENSADIDWACMLSKLLKLLMPIIKS